MKRRRIKAHLQLVVMIVGIFGGILFISLRLSSDQFSQEFYAQNYQAIESGNAFALIQQLNSLMNQEVISCVVATIEGKTFFSSGTRCQNAIGGREVEIASQGHDVVIRLLYRHSNLFYVYIAAALLISLFVANFILTMIFKVEDFEHKAALRVNELARRVAHDIRSPLSALNSLARIIDSEHERETLKQVIERINSIAEDLLVESKSKASLVEVKDIRVSTRCKVKATIQRVIAEKVFELQDNPVEVTLRANLDLVSENLEVAFSGVELARILSNLINNSVKAIVSDGLVSLEVREGGEFVYIIITDFGAGMSEEVLVELTRRPITTVKDESISGNGIGVYSAAQKIRDGGGDISYQSKLGVGTQVTIKIPAI